MPVLPQFRGETNGYTQTARGEPLHNRAFDHARLGQSKLQCPLVAGQCSILIGGRELSPCGALPVEQLVPTDLLCPDVPAIRWETLFFVVEELV